MTQEDSGGKKENKKHSNQWNYGITLQSQSHLQWLSRSTVGFASVQIYLFILYIYLFILFFYLFICCHYDHNLLFFSVCDLQSLQHPMVSKRGTAAVWLSDWPRPLSLNVKRKQTIQLLQVWLCFPYALKRSVSERAAGQGGCCSQLIGLSMWVGLWIALVVWVKPPAESGGGQLDVTMQQFLCSSFLSCLTEWNLFLSATFSCESTMAAAAKKSEASISFLALSLCLSFSAVFQCLKGPLTLLLF